MIIELNEARELCSKSEWKLVESSFFPVVETLPRSDLKSRLDRARKLCQKTTDLVSLQHSESRKRTTRRKIELFGGVVDRFEARLNVIEGPQTDEPSPKAIHDKKMAQETRKLDMDALQERADHEIESRKSESLSAMAFHGEQQMRKSGARAVQGHVGAVNRRQQGRRDSKNR